MGPYCVRSVRVVSSSSFDRQQGRFFAYIPASHFLVRPSIASSTQLLGEYSWWSFLDSVEGIYLAGRLLRPSSKPVNQNLSLLPFTPYYSSLNFFFYYYYYYLTGSRWVSSLPSCLWSLRIFPSLPGSRLTIFYRDASSAFLQLVNLWLNFTYSRSHAFRYERKNTNPTFGKNRTHDFRTSRCAGYLLDHSGASSILI